MKISTIIVSALLATGITFAEEAIEKPERPEINKEVVKEKILSKSSAEHSRAQLG